jgi:hypothetical protein
MNMNYKALFENLFDDLESAAFEDPKHEGFVEGVRDLLTKYAEQRGKGEEYEEMKRMDESG